VRRFVLHPLLALVLGYGCYVSLFLLDLLGFGSSILCILVGYFLRRLTRFANNSSSRVLEAFEARVCIILSMREGASRFGVGQGWVEIVGLVTGPAGEAIVNNRWGSRHHGQAAWLWMGPGGSSKGGEPYSQGMATEGGLRRDPRP
jgi:hypothetical protein